MKKFGISLAVIAFNCAAESPSPYAPAPKEAITLDYLLEACGGIGDPESANGLVPFFDCHSYVYGVLDSIIAMNVKHSTSNGACVPESLAPWQVMKDLESLVSSGEHGSENAAHVILGVLHEKYPCR
jgi:hypothetical protein